MKGAQNEMFLSSENDFHTVSQVNSNFEYRILCTFQYATSGENLQFCMKKQHLQHLKYINNTGKVIHAYEFCLGKPK